MWPMLILLAIAAMASGPIALFISLSALRKIKDLERQRWVLPDGEDFRRRAPLVPVESVTPGEALGPPVTKPEPIEPPQAPRVQPQVAEQLLPKVQLEPPAQKAEVAQPKAWSVTEMLAKESSEKGKPIPSSETLQLEQRIGTRWVLVAGVVTVIFAVGYFLKYAHDNQWIGPWGKIICALIGGFTALVVGEVTRRRGYEIVAKGVTALGFAILYAAVFAAHRWYGLVGSAPAYVLAIGVTVAAMLYAVVLDEIVAAMLALIGGYITPVIISTGQNAPTLLFSYVLILSAGAMLCAYWRRWPALNVAAFLGTFALYTGWFERFYRPAMRATEGPDQLGVALFWLTVFFLVYLILPIVHGLIRRVKSQTSDVVLLLANAAAVFYYLWTILRAEHSSSLALCSLAMGVTHLALLVPVYRRCKEDSNLLRALLATGLAFVTLAVPLYLRAYAIVMAWAVEGVVLAVIGLRYRSVLTQVSAGIAMVLSLGKLVLALPLHDIPFRLFFNVEFGAWCFVAMAVWACYVLCRRDQYLDEVLRASLVDVVYVVGLLLLLAAISQELWHHVRLNLRGQDQVVFVRYMMPVFPAFFLLCLVKPVSPRGKVSLGLAAVLAVAGSFSLIFPFSELHSRAFIVFFNLDFFWILVFVGALLGGGWLLYRDRQDDREEFLPPVFLPLTAIVLLGIMLAQEIWCYWRCLTPQPSNWKLHAHMCIAMAWATYATIVLLIGLRHRNRLIKTVAGIVLALAVGTLLIRQPMHAEPFRLFLNVEFVAWFVVALAVLAFHVLYRLKPRIDDALQPWLTDVLYTAGLLILLAAIAQELWYHVGLNLQGQGQIIFVRYMMPILSMFLLLCLIRPISPRGKASQGLAAVLAVAGSFALVFSFSRLHTQAFLIFFNLDFLWILTFVAALLAGTWLLCRDRNDQEEFLPPVFLLMTAILLLWIMLTQEIWCYWRCLESRNPNWPLLAHMCISIMWAVYAVALMVIGFWRGVRLLRYVALAGFVLLLAKVFLVDTRTLESIYRIAGFLVTGLVLVGVSYLYQFLKKKGFFDRMLAEEQKES